MIKLFVVGYPLDIQDAELIEIFSIHGMIHSIELLKDRVSGQHKGFGFVEMMDQPGAERAIAAINGMVIRGRKVSVRLADENRQKKPKTFKENGFPVRREVVGEVRSEEFSTKRPRKLKSDTFRSGK